MSARGSLPFLILGLLVVVPTASGHARDNQILMSAFPLDDNYVTGYVVWKDNKVSLAWEAGAPTDPQGGPAPTGADGTFKIESSPAPSTLYLNVTRTIEVLFFVKDGVGGPGNDLVIKIGSTIVGGTIYKNNGGFSEYIEGYTNYNVRLQSEILVIPKDAILTIEYPSSDQGQFKVAGAVCSVVRIPVLGPTERLLRYPELLNTPETSQAGAVPWVLVAIGVRPRRLRSAFVAFSVASVILSGCMGGGPGPGATRGTDGKEDGGANATMGTIVGVVSDNFSNPLRDVYISVLHEAPYTRSDLNGVFTLHDVPAGEQVVRFEKEGFASLETQVTVAAGATARVEARLISLDPTYEQRMAGRHPHDMWGTDTTKTLYTGTLAFHSSYDDGSCFSPTGCRSYCQG